MHRHIAAAAAERSRPSPGQRSHCLCSATQAHCGQPSSPLWKVPLLVPVPAAPPVLHICGVASGIRIMDMQIGNAQTSPEPGVLVTSTCTAHDDDDALDLAGDSTADDSNSSSATKGIATRPSTYTLPPKIDPANIGTGLSVSFHRVHTLGGGPYSTRVTPINSLEPPFQRISTAH